MLSTGTNSERLTWTYTLRRLPSSGGETGQPSPGRDWPCSTSFGIFGYTLGPPALRLSLPLTISIESRSSSAVSRRIGKRQNNSFAGSTFKLAGDAFADI